MPADLLNMREAAGQLRSSIPTLRVWVKQKRLPVIRIGRKLLFKSEDIRTFIDKSRINVETD